MQSSNGLSTMFLKLSQVRLLLCGRLVLQIITSGRLKRLRYAMLKVIECREKQVSIKIYEWTKK